MFEGLKFINLTPHAITIRNDEVDFVIEPSGMIARVTAELVESDTKGIFVQTFGNVEGLPEASDNTIFVVSGLVLSALSALAGSRKDVVAPMTTRAERDEAGRIVSVPGFVR